MNRIHFRLAILTTAPCMLALASGAAAQTCADNLPPPGNIGYVYKTLDQVQPRVPINACNTPGDSDSVYRITQPGSYYLTGRVQVANGKKGIEIVASDVTIDLMGFDISGTGFPTSLDGIEAGTNIRRVTIRNGRIVSVGGRGIDASQDTNVEFEVENVSVSACTLAGAALGPRASVDSCTFEQNVAGGLSVGSDSKVARSRATFNTGFGGINAGSSSVVRECVSNDNSTLGIACADRGLVVDCVADDNSLVGIEIGGNGRVENCTVAGGGGAGINGYGSDPGNGVTVVGCNVSDHAAVGIELGNGCAIRDCVVNNNNGGGIKIGANNTVTGNHCSFHLNTLAPGMLVTGNYNRIDSNMLTANNNIGLKVTGTGNIVTRNAASNNFTNFDIAAGNTAFVTNSASTTSAFANIQP